MTLYFGVESGDVYEHLANEAPIDTSGRIITDQKIPLAEFLVKDWFPFVKGDYPRPERTAWSKEQVEELGRMIVRDLAELDPPTILARPIINKLSTLGIFPSKKYFEPYMGHYNGIIDFRQQIGADELEPVRHIKSKEERTKIYDKYAKLGLEEFTNLILSRYDDLLELPEGRHYDGPITTIMIEAMCRMDIAPSCAFIEDTYGGLTELNEYRGFPDIESWNETDYIQYGARVIKENGPGSLTETNINKLSVHHLGPSNSTIFNKFGSLSAFQNLAMAEYVRQSVIDEARSAAIEQHFEETPYNGGAPKDPDKRMLIWARYQVAKACLPSRVYTSKLPEISKLPNEDFVRRLLGVVQGLTEAYVEIMAEDLQVMDYIWPPADQRSLKL